MLSNTVLIITSILLLSCTSEPEFKEVKKTSVANNASLPDSLIEGLSKHFLEQKSFGCFPLIIRT